MHPHEGPEQADAAVQALTKALHAVEQFHDPSHPFVAITLVKLRKAFTEATLAAELVGDLVVLADRTR